MRIANLKSSFLAIVTASVASLCCLLPLTVILLGLGSGAFMMTTMRYRAIFIPAGVIGVGLGWLLHFRERRACNALGCRMAGGTLNLSLLLVATLVVAAAVALDQFPSVTADLLTRATARASTAAPMAGSSSDHSTMRHEGSQK
ncbi:MAG: hypothetical protein HY574_11615 [candidate division NC10 bacterium]|nr:hypothetical protein [candidate division NC10 bacterium]